MSDRAEYFAAYYRAHKPHVQALRRLYYQQNKPAFRRRAKLWRKRNAVALKVARILGITVPEARRRIQKRGVKS